MDKSSQQPTDPNQNPDTNEHPLRAINSGTSSSSSNQSTPFASSVGSNHILSQIADQFQDNSRDRLNISNLSNGNNRESTDDHHNDDDDGEGGDDDHHQMDYDDDPEGLIAHGNESTGRWTRNEHDLFLDALKKYGKVKNIFFMHFFVYVLLISMITLKIDVNFHAS